MDAYSNLGINSKATLAAESGDICKSPFPRAKAFLILLPAITSLEW